MRFFFLKYSFYFFFAYSNLKTYKSSDIFLPLVFWYRINAVTF